MGKLLATRDRAELAKQAKAKADLFQVAFDAGWEWCSIVYDPETGDRNLLYGMSEWEADAMHAAPIADLDAGLVAAKHLVLIADPKFDPKSDPKSDVKGAGR